MEQENSSGGGGHSTSATPGTDRKAKDLATLAIAGIVGLIAVALLALALHLAVQRAPEMAPLVTGNDRETSPADTTSPPAGSKRFTDRVPSEGEAAAIAIDNSQAPASDDKLSTERVPGVEETDASDKLGQPSAGGGKKFTDRIIGE
jgi:hypothetical protein